MGELEVVKLLPNNFTIDLTNLADISEVNLLDKHKSWTFENTAQYRHPEENTLLVKC